MGFEINLTGSFTMRKCLFIASLYLLASITITTSSLAQQPASTQSKSIQLNVPIEGVLPSDGVHTYTVEIPNEHLAYGFVMQKTVDVVVRIYNPSGEEIGEYDGPARGKETFRFMTKADGVYHIEVTPFEEQSGDYSITLQVVEKLAEDPSGKTDQLMIPYTGNDTPGAAVLVMKDGKILHQKGYGMANLAYGVPFKVDTPTNIGSTSKQFTAFAILLLQEQGKLHVDDDVRKYIPELPDFGKTVTIRHLLSHTTGYREFLNAFAMTGAHSAKEFSDEQIIRLVQRQPELQNDPGAEFNYNNTGFYLARLIVERITESDFEDWTRENIFLPLGMTKTWFRVSPEQIIPGRSMGYAPSEDGFIEKTDLAGAMGAGGIYTTLEDLSKWIVNFKEHKIGSDATFELMMTSNLLTTGTPSGYGFGLFIDDYKGQKQVQHGGADVAHRSMLVYFPEIDASVITQSNLSSFAGNSAYQIADFFFEEYFEQPKAEDTASMTVADADTAEFVYNAATFDALTGKYELSVMPGFILTFDREGDRIYTQATGQPEINIKATSDSTFTLIGVQASLTFHLNEDGSADSLTLHQNGNHIARKMTWKPTAAELESYVGSYFSDELETMYHVEMGDDGLQLVHYHIAEPMKLTASKKDTFGATFPMAGIEFVRDESGAITGFKASNGRTRNVLFRVIESNLPE